MKQNITSHSLRNKNNNNLQALTLRLAVKNMSNDEFSKECKRLKFDTFFKAL